MQVTSKTVEYSSVLTSLGYIRRTVQDDDTIRKESRLSILTRLDSIYGELAEHLAEEFEDVPPPPGFTRPTRQARHSPRRAGNCGVDAAKCQTECVD